MSLTPKVVSNIYQSYYNSSYPLCPLDYSIVNLEVSFGHVSKHIYNGSSIRVYLFNLIYNKGVVSWNPYTYIILLLILYFYQKALLCQVETL